MTKTTLAVFAALAVGVSAMQTQANDRGPVCDISKCSPQDSSCCSKTVCDPNDPNCVAVEASTCNVAAGGCYKDTKCAGGSCDTGTTKKERKGFFARIFGFLRR